jgi:polyisoprenoid-binding protein YceI
MPRRILIPIVAAAVVIVAGAAGAYAYFFSGLRTAPPALALATPTAAAPASGSASPAASTGGTTTWTVASGSVAGYRVREQFAGQTSAHEAVARTSQVSGQVAIAPAGGSYQLTAATITVSLSSLASVDSVAGYNVTNRDRIVQRSLEVDSFPSAVFVADPTTLPANAAGGQAVSVSVPGKLTVHGVTRDVTANLQLRVSGGTAQVVGTIATNMTDFGVSPPAIGFTTVQPAVTIEVSLNLTRSA